MRGLLDRDEVKFEGSCNADWEKWEKFQRAADWNGPLEDWRRNIVRSYWFCEWRASEYEDEDWWLDVEDDGDGSRTRCAEQAAWWPEVFLPSENSIAQWGSLAR